jgi:hypothetical protein
VINSWRLQVKEQFNVAKRASTSSRVTRTGLWPLHNYSEFAK